MEYAGDKDDIDLHHQIYKGDPRPHSTPCNGVVSHGAQIGGIRVFADHTRKINRKQMRSRYSHAVQCFNVCLSSRSDRSRCRWHTHLPNHSFLITGKPRIPPIWAPCWDQNGTGFGISSVSSSDLHQEINNIKHVKILIIIWPSKGKHWILSCKTLICIWPSKGKHCVHCHVRHWSSSDHQRENIGYTLT